MLRLLVLFVSLFWFASCSLPGTQDESAVIEDNTTLFENDEVSMRVPRAWSGVVQNQKTPMPRMGTLVAAFVSKDIGISGYANNLVILSDTLPKILTSRRYAELNNIQTTKNYFEYKNIKEEDFTFSDNETSRLYLFEARYNESTPRMRYLQTARVCGTKVYLIHFSLSLNKKSDNYAELIKTFTCK